MSKAIPTNTAASAKQRLLNRARTKKEDFNLLLTKIRARTGFVPHKPIAIQRHLRSQGNAALQGSSPMAQWGSSVITKGNQAAYTQHRTTSQGTVASIQGADGGRAVGANTVYGKGAMGMTAGGDLYAGKDGNVYKNTGSGWQKYDNGSWNTAATRYTSSTQPRSQNSQQANLTSSQTGTTQQRTQNYQQRSASSQRPPSTMQVQPQSSNSRPTTNATAQNVPTSRVQNFQQQWPVGASVQAATQPSGRSFQQ